MSASTMTGSESSASVLLLASDPKTRVPLCTIHCRMQPATSPTWGTGISFVRGGSHAVRACRGAGHKAIIVWHMRGERGYKERRYPMHAQAHPHGRMPGFISSHQSVECCMACFLVLTWAPVV